MKTIKQFEINGVEYNNIEKSNVFGNNENSFIPQKSISQITQNIIDNENYINIDLSKTPHSPNNIKSIYFPIKNTDSVSIFTEAELRDKAYVFKIYDSNYNYIGGWTCGNSTRTIDISEYENVAYCDIEISIKCSKMYQQYIKINDVYNFIGKVYFTTNDFRAVTRGNIYYDSSDSTIHLTKGYYYFYSNVMQYYFISYSVSDEEIYSISKDECLVLSVIHKKIIIKPVKEVKDGIDLILLQLDGVYGLFGGLFYEHIQDNKMKDIQIYNPVYYNCNTVSKTYVHTNKIYVSLNDILDIYVDSSIYPDYGIYLYTENGNYVNAYTIPNGYRQITITDENVDYVVCNFKTSSLEQQYIKQNGTIVASINTYNHQKNQVLYNQCKLIGSVIVKSDGTVYATMLDVYCNHYPTFKRFNGDLFQITSTGTNSVIYDPNTETFCSGINNLDGYVCGVSRGLILFLGESVQVQYEDTSINQYNIYDLSIKLNDLNHCSTPEFIFTESQITLRRALSYINNDSYLLAHITDVHSGYSNKYNHIRYLSELNDIWQFNVLCNGGDIGLDVGETTEEAYNLLHNTKYGMSTTSPWIFNKGNHERLIPMSELGSLFMTPVKRQFQNIVFGTDNLLYGYIDDSNIKVRTFFINTSDTDNSTHYFVSTAQLQWLIDTLNDTPADYKIIMTMHRCIHEIGIWISSGTAAINTPYMVALRNIIEAYTNKTSGTYDDLSLSYDFTSASGKLVCVLSGDSHYNNYIKDNNVNYIVRQGYGGVSASDIVEGGTYDSFNYSTQCLFDILIVKDSSNAKIFRIGAGGESRDLEFTF